MSREESNRLLQGTLGLLVLKALARDKSSKALPHAVMDHNQFSVFIGFPKNEELQNKYLKFLPSRAAE